MCIWLPCTWAYEIHLHSWYCKVGRYCMIYIVKWNGYRTCRRLYACKYWHEHIGSWCSYKLCVISEITYNHICTSYQFTSIITHGGCWENMIKVCKSQAKAEWSTNFSSVLLTSCMGYYSSKPIENVVYCFYKITITRQS